MHCFVSCLGPLHNRPPWQVLDLVWVPPGPQVLEQSLQSDQSPHTPEKRRIINRMIFRLVLKVYIVSLYWGVDTMLKIDEVFVSTTHDVLS